MSRLTIEKIAKAVTDAIMAFNALTGRPERQTFLAMVAAGVGR